MTKPNYLKDVGLWLFGVLSLAALAVSIPATLAVVGWFHLDGTEFGYWMSIAMITLFELAAVGCIITPLWAPAEDLNGMANLLLGLTTGANFIHGLQIFAGQKDLPASVAYIQQTPILLWIACALYAGIVPFLLKKFLSKFVQRVQRLRGDATDAQLSVQRAMEPVQLVLAQAELLAQAMQRLQVLQTPALQTMQLHARVAETVQPVLQDALPIQPTYAAPVQTCIAPMHDALHNAFEYSADAYSCIKCNRLNDAPGQGLEKRKSSGRWGCPKCKASE